MRMDAGGEAPAGAVVDGGQNFPISERSTSPREATNNKNNKSVPSSISPMAPLNLQSPLKQPHAIMEQEKARTAGGTKFPPLQATQGGGMAASMSAPGLQGVPGATQRPGSGGMHGASRAVPNSSVMQAVARNPGPLDPMQKTISDGFALGSQTTGGPTRGADELPIINKDRMNINPGMTYGGGFQLFGDRPEHGGVRGLDQKDNFPNPKEQKIMIEGTDGKFYIGDEAVVGPSGDALEDSRGE